MNKTFRDFGIDLPDAFSGEKYTTCPECSPSRRKKNVKCLGGNGDKGVWNCHHCGFSGTLKEGVQNKSKPYQGPRTYVKPDYKKTAMPDKVVSWFQERGISREVLERNKIGYGNVYMPQEEDFVNAIQFPYYRKGEVVNVKYRDGKKNFRMETGAERIMYGLDDITGDTAIIVEGEIDKLSLEMAGYTNVLSVPDGAPSLEAKNYEKKFEFLESALELLDSLKTIIIAVDKDGPGMKLEEELARRLGKERCFRAIYPDDCKDTNEVLVKYGPGNLKECINNSNPYPINGVFELKDIEKKLDTLYIEGFVKGKNPGWNTIAEHYTVRPGEWTIVTGIPSHGKSSFIDAAIVRMSKMHGWTFGIFSPENQPIERHVSKLLELYVGFPFNKGYNERMTQDMYDCGKAFIQENFFFILPDEEDSQTLKNVLNLAKILVLRKGIKGLIIDPWNEIDHSIHKDFSETEYISICLSEIRKFARIHDVHVWLIAHPTKLKKNDKTGKYPVPTPYDISGSAHFRNKADNALCIWRDLHEDTKKNIVQIHIQKIRFKEIGKIGVKELYYDRLTGDFSDIL